MPRAEETVLARIGPFRIVGIDEFSLRLDEQREITRGDRVGGQRWVFVGYYSSMDGAVRAIARQFERKVQGKDLDAWLARYSELLKSFAGAAVAKAKIPRRPLVVEE